MYEFCDKPHTHGIFFPAVSYTLLNVGQLRWQDRGIIRAANGSLSSTRARATVSVA